MHWEKKICFRLTTRRIVGAILAATTAVNLVIVGTAYEAAAPTSTFTPTATGMASPTVRSQTDTLIPPVSVTTVMAMPSPSPTATWTATDTAMPAPTLSLCIVSAYWPLYRVQSGETLTTLARATGSAAEDLRVANCLPDYQIYAGQLLYVPRLPFSPPSVTPSSTATSTPTDTSTPTPTNTTGVTVTYSPTATPTTPTSPPTVFGKPFVCINVVNMTSGYLMFSVSITPSQNIKSVVVTYQRADGTMNTLSMALFSPGVYSVSVLEGYSGNATVPYSFTAEDNFGSRSYSGEYKTPLTSCLT